MFLVTDEKRLSEYLFSSNKSTRYNPNIRPVPKSANRMRVDVRLGIKRIFEMDENNHRVILFAVLFQVFILKSFKKINKNQMI